MPGNDKKQNFGHLCAYILATSYDMPKVGIPVHRQLKAICTNIIGWSVGFVVADVKQHKRRYSPLYYLCVIVD